MGVSAKPHHHPVGWTRLFFHFTDEHAEVQGGWIRCLGTYSRTQPRAPAPLLRVGRGSDCRVLSSRVHVLNHPVLLACGWECAWASEVSIGRKRAGPWRTPWFAPTALLLGPLLVIPQQLLILSQAPAYRPQPAGSPFPSSLRPPPALTHSESTTFDSITAQEVRST